MNRGEEAQTIKRKTRSDKKRDVKPTISIELKSCIYRISYITSTPVKDVVEMLCIKGLRTRVVIDFLSQYFLRDFSLKNTYYIGDISREPLSSKRQKGKTERITTRFNQETYEQIRNLSVALDVTPSKATAILLDASVRNTNLLNSFIKLYLNKHLDDNRMKEMKNVLKYINKNNPYYEEISWFHLISKIYDEIKDTTVGAKERIETWLNKYN